MSKKFAKSLGSGRVGWLDYVLCRAATLHGVVLFPFPAPLETGAGVQATLRPFWLVDRTVPVGGCMLG